MMIQLCWHDYRYYPYERDLARRELHALLGVDGLEISNASVSLPLSAKPEAVGRLTYFARADGGPSPIRTLQSSLEETARKGRNRQATRYSAHGLHDYKGKFNPQVARAVLNIFGAGEGSRVLDPFCGSGTTLVECCHLGAMGVGVDANPLAAFIANTKIESLSTPIRLLREDHADLVRQLGTIGRPARLDAKNAREEYLRSWFPEEQLAWLEVARRTMESACANPDVFLAIASNLLRDYSFQEPGDLRIRRRITAMPSTPFEEAFGRACEQFLDRLEASQAVLGLCREGSKAIVADARRVPATALGDAFDLAVTSPPYATALPYIDTQRLSLVWLGLEDPSRLAGLDASLIGSREATSIDRKILTRRLEDNAASLPERQWRFCLGLLKAVGGEDGFRRKAVPGLTYRYMEAMRDSFSSVLELVKPGARYALIVGHNHTVLSGARIEIDTPLHLAALGTASGWSVEEQVPLQTYYRYGLHTSNSIKSETLLILRKPG